jgi:hypothetical protein
LACSAKAPLWQQSSTMDLPLGAALLDEFPDLLGRYAAIAWGIQIGAGGGQEETVAAAEYAAARIIEQQKVIRGAVVEESRQTIAVEPAPEAAPAKAGVERAKP